MLELRSILNLSKWFDIDRSAKLLAA